MSSVPGENLEFGERGQESTHTHRESRKSRNLEGVGAGESGLVTSMQPKVFSSNWPPPQRWTSRLLTTQSWLSAAPLSFLKAGQHAYHLMCLLYCGTGTLPPLCKGPWLPTHAMVRGAPCGPELHSPFGSFVHSAELCGLSAPWCLHL